MPALELLKVHLITKLRANEVMVRLYSIHWIQKEVVRPEEMTKVGGQELNTYWTPFPLRSPCDGNLSIGWVRRLFSENDLAFRVPGGAHQWFTLPRGLQNLLILYVTWSNVNRQHSSERPVTAMNPVQVLMINHNKKEQLFCIALWRRRQPAIPKPMSLAEENSIYKMICNSPHVRYFQLDIRKHGCLQVKVELIAIICRDAIQKILNYEQGNMYTYSVWPLTNANVNWRPFTVT